MLTMASDKGEKTVSAEQLKSSKAKISLVKTSDRASGIKKAIEIMNIKQVKGEDVLLKPNFNTADPFPGFTHNDTFTNLILHLKEMGTKNITIREWQAA